MKYLTLLSFLIICTACNNMDIEFKDEQLPVFYVYAQSGHQAKVFISESSYTDQADISETDTLQVELKMYKNGVFTEVLHKTDMYYISHEDTFIVPDQIAYRSSCIIESNKTYSFILNYKKYPELVLEANIPATAQIDSFSVNPNVALTRDDRYSQHNFTVFFSPFPENHLHYFIAVYMERKDDLNSDGKRRGGFYIESKYLRDEEIIRGEPNSINFNIESELKHGDFTPTVYLMTISDDYYKYIMYLHTYQEFKESAEFFSHIPAHTPYSMIPDAFANVFAYSTAKKTGDEIQVTEPRITD